MQLGGGGETGLALRVAGGRQANHLGSSEQLGMGAREKGGKDRAEGPGWAGQVRLGEIRATTQEVPRFCPCLPPPRLFSAQQPE